MIRAFRKYTNTLQSRLVLATILPLLGLTIVLTAATIIDRHQDLTKRLQESGSGIATYLASVSDFALYTADKDLLNSLVAATSRLEGVSGVAFLNTTREAVVSTFTDEHGFSEFPGDAPPAVPKPPDKYLYFEQQVIAVDLNTEDYNRVEVDDSQQVVGWVIVALDPAASMAERQAILTNGVSLATGIMAMAIVLSYLLSRNIIGPIGKLTSVVNRIEGGDFSVRAPAAPSYEFNVLAQGINHMAASIEESQDRLQEEVTSATHQLQETLVDLRIKNGELEIAMQAADAANAAKTDFLARMSHELRTPLTSIQGFIKLLESADLGKPELQYCKIISQASQLLLQLIDDILEFTRLQAGATNLEELPFDFFQCLEVPIQLLAPTAHEKRLELILDIEPNVPLALIADSRRIRQIISNLVSNSIKFTDTGSVLVRVSLLAEEADHCRLALMVRDSGIGISDEQKKHIFKAFTQADVSISRRFGGTGLGLSIVNGLINLMGGSISVQSAEGEGSEITVILPLKKQSGMLANQATGQEKIALHLALYDPDPASRLAMEHMLARIIENFDSYADIGELRTGLATTRASVVLVNGASVAPVNPGAYPLLLDYIRQCTDLPLIITLPLKQIQKRVTTGENDVLQPASFVGKPISVEGLYNLLVGSPGVPETNETISNSLSGLSALVAEDNEFSQLLIKTLLERAGCRYVLAGNGRRAIEMSTREEFDILIIDGHMPELDGWETLREIRSLTNINHASPAIFLTADVLASEAKLPAGVGLNHVLHKPFDETALINTIRKLVGKESSVIEQTSAIWKRVPKEKFFSEIKALIDAASKANKTQNPIELRDAVHQLLGIAGVFKLSALGQLATVLHNAARAEDASRVDAALDDLATELQQLKLEAEA